MLTPTRCTYLAFCIHAVQVYLAQETNSGGLLRVLIASIQLQEPYTELRRSTLSRQQASEQRNGMQAAVARARRQQWQASTGLD